MILISCCIAYLIGAIPFQWCMIRDKFPFFKKETIKFIILDIFKGILATVIAFLFAGWFAACLAAISVVIGSMYSLFMGFRGGSGLAVAAGALFILSPILILIGLCVYFLCFFTTRFLFLSTLLSIVTILILAVVFAIHLYVWLVILCLGVIILFPQKCYWQRGSFFKYK